MVHVGEQSIPTLAAKGYRAIRTKAFAKAGPIALQLLADVVAVVVTMIAFYLLRLRDSTFHPAVGTAEFFWSVLAASVVYWVGLFWLAGLYQNWFVRSPFEEAYTVMKTTAIGGGIGVMAFFFDMGWISYKIIAYTVLLTIAVIILRYGARRLQSFLRAQGIVILPTLLVGDREGLQEFLNRYDRHAAVGYVLVGAVVSNQTSLPSLELPILGDLTELELLCERIRPVAAILAFGRADHDRILQLATVLTSAGVQTMIVPDLYQVVMGTVRTLSLYGVPLIAISPHLLKPWQALVKRTLDIVVSASVLVLGMPLWVLIALLIKLDSPGPVLFTQYRVGRNNRPFKLYKFRSMTHGKWDGTWTQLNDPRVTRVGAIIRRLYLDEIPQFWNVLKGDMSLIGPRPEQAVLVEQFQRAVPYYNRRHVVRPGITGWWQVQRERSVRPDMVEEIRSRLQDDFYYIENMSLRLDLEIIIRTVIVMLRGHGIA